MLHTTNFGINWFKTFPNPLLNGYNERYLVLHGDFENEKNGKNFLTFPSGFKHRIPAHVLNYWRWWDQIYARKVKFLDFIKEHSYFKTISPYVSYTKETKRRSSRERASPKKQFLNQKIIFPNEKKILCGPYNVKSCSEFTTNFFFSTDPAVQKAHFGQK